MNIFILPYIIDKENIIDKEKKHECDLLKVLNKITYYVLCK
jgi:hypothetical protein